MKNTLNPCKCGGTAGSDRASDIIYNGLDITCVPGLIGKDLAFVIKALGDALCENQGITVVLDNSLIYGLTAADLNASPMLSALKPGDFAYSITNGVKFTRLLSGNWSVQIIEIL